MEALFWYSGVMTRASRGELRARCIRAAILATSFGLLVVQAQLQWIMTDSPGMHHFLRAHWTRVAPCYGH
ncbi:MAG: hypothetical protein QY311_02775 [Candidatus Paceibacterota bacterium]|nr:MAG: hypothetical protein QY311_02775 [Candidatus Paceibacterota bacterium]